MADASATAVTAVIVSYNSGAVIDACLHSIDGVVPTLLVDNASSDDTLECAKAFPWLRVLRNEENFGFGRAANIALSVTDSPLILLLNPDVRICAEDIAILRRAAEQYPRGAIFGPALFYPAGIKSKPGYGPPLFSAGHALFSTWCARWQRLHWSPVDSARVAAHEVGFLSGCVLFLRREAMTELGGFDERIFLYYEETDLCLRALLADWQLLRVPAATALHLGSCSSPGMDAGQLKVLIHWHFAWSRFYMAHKWQRGSVWWSCFLVWRLSKLAFRLIWQSISLIVGSFLDLLRGRSSAHRQLHWRCRVACLSGAWTAYRGRPSSLRLGASA